MEVPKGLLLACILGLIILTILLKHKTSVNRTIVYSLQPQSQPVAGAPKCINAPATPVKDVIDDSGAMVYLDKYAKLFSKKGQRNMADPASPQTIIHWWQAAAMIDWFINSPLRYQCQDTRACGNWNTCQDPPFTVKPPCLVYSFGINYDFSFDDAMGKLGCEVHSFDPSMTTKSHRRNANVTFYKIGIGSHTSNGFRPRRDAYVRKDGTKWKVRTLKSIKRRLGHSDRVIDVLKLDIEAYEWSVLDNMMETGMMDKVRQFGLEFHLFNDMPIREDYVCAYNVYRRLREMGFREYSSYAHPQKLKEDSYNNQGDIELVNSNFRYPQH